MDIYEITGFKTGIENSGVNFLDPPDAFESIHNGYVYRQELKSRNGFCQFGNRLSDKTRVMGIFENILPNSVRQLLVFSKDYLYRYNSATDSFIQVPFTSAAVIVSFGITNNTDYVSGTTYLTKTGTQRFVFTGRGMSDVFFYNGVSVKRFTNAVDNPDYQAPAMGALSKATKVIMFGERLNFFVPTTGGTVNNQAVLYSGIRDAAGNGDKFNTPGSGMLSADTYELMKGASINGNLIVMNFEKSNYTLEKTRDAFNPYLIKRIPSTLIGTNSTFSSVSWGGETKSLGRMGMITTDGRTSLRFDNKIPYFTRDMVDQENIELVYGGFDQINSQFLFAYREQLSELADVTQDKVVVYNYEENTWAFNDQRFSCFGQSDDGQALAWDDIEGSAEHPSWARWDTTEEIWNEIGVSKYSMKDLAGDNDGFVYQLNVDFDDYFVDITNITNAAQAVVTVAESSFKIGDKVVIENATGMTEINNTVVDVVAATDTSITLRMDSTLFTAYAAGGSLSKVIDFSAEFSPFNPYRSEGRKCYVSYIEFLVNTKGGGIDVEAFADEAQTAFKKTSITPNTLLTTDKQWIGMVIDQEADFITFVLNNESWSTQTIITSVRVHCKRGGLTGN